MEDDVREMTSAELAALCSNLQKACSKQHRSEEAALFGQLASYYDQKPMTRPTASYQMLLDRINGDLSQAYAEASEQVTHAADRGALRALVWVEKVSKLLKSLLVRYEKQKQGLLENTSVWVCEVCGFVYVGERPPEICPICKVPGFKIHAVQKEAV